MTEETAVPEWLAAAAYGLASGDVDAWMAMYADDAVHEFPFAEAGAIRRLEGADSIRTYMEATRGSVRFGSLDDVHVRDLGEEIIIEAEGHHFDATSGDPFDIRYLWIITRRNGKVTRLQDYMGPRRENAVR